MGRSHKLIRVRNSNYCSCYMANSSILSASEDFVQNRCEILLITPQFGTTVVLLISMMLNGVTYMYLQKFDKFHVYFV
jgi:hypothetical protein